MTVKRVSLGMPFRWLAEAFAMCRTHARVLSGAASLLLLVALLPSLAQALVESALQPSASSRVVIQVLFSLVAMLLFPPVVGGFYRIVHALYEGRPAKPGDVFALYQDGPAARRLIATNIIFVLVSVLMLAGLALAIGGAELSEFMRAVAAMKPGDTNFPPLPAGLLPMMSVLMILILLIMTAQGLATAEVAITERSPLPSASDAFKWSLRNLGPLLLFYVPMAVVGFIVFMIVALVAVLIGSLLSLASPVLATLLLAPIMLLLILVMYALMFTFFYHAWRDTLGTSTQPPVEHQIAV